MNTVTNYLILLITAALIFATGMFLYDDNRPPNIVEPIVTPLPEVAKVLPECVIDGEGNVGEGSQSRNVDCIFSIEAGTSDATLKVSSTTIRISRNAEDVIAFSCDSAAEYYWYECDFGTEAIYLLDVTNDGYTDIKLKNECGAYQCAYTYFIFDASTNQYILSDALRGVIEPSFDPLTHTIYTYAKGRGLGDMFMHSEYALADSGQYELMETCSQDMVDWDAEQSDYLYVCRELKDGVFATSSQEIIPYAEVWGE